MFVILWEFQVKSGLEKTFERVYGPEGDWARFFRHSPEYRGTRLVQDVATPRRYLTLDYWTTQSAFEAFRSEHAIEYERIDRRCESLTENERHISSIEVPDSAPENPWRSN
jgi:heme-degrading monooxygenase HmoA